MLDLRDMQPLCVGICSSLGLNVPLRNRLLWHFSHFRAYRKASQNYQGRKPDGSAVSRKMKSPAVGVVVKLSSLNFSITV